MKELGEVLFGIIVSITALLVFSAIIFKIAIPILESWPVRDIKPGICYVECPGDVNNPFANLKYCVPFKVLDRKDEYIQVQSLESKSIYSAKLYMNFKVTRKIIECEDIHAKN